MPRFPDVFIVALGMVTMFVVILFPAILGVVLADLCYRWKGNTSKAIVVGWIVGIGGYVAYIVLFVAINLGVL